jgi:hypothetical protein
MERWPLLTVQWYHGSGGHGSPQAWSFSDLLAPWPHHPHCTCFYTDCIQNVTASNYDDKLHFKSVLYSSKKVWLTVHKY